MTKKYKIQLITLIVVFFSLGGCKKDNSITKEEELIQIPINISGLIPAQNIVGSDFMIVGSGFDPIASNNIVKIGNITLTVKKATATFLIVNTPTSWILDKVSVSTGLMSATTLYNYRVSENPYKMLRLRSSLEGISDLFEFTYNSDNQLIKKVTNYINPINRLTLYVGRTDYYYDGVGSLIKEIYTPLNSNVQTITEYFYTDGHLTSDKIYNFDMNNSGITNLLSHTYVILGRQLVSKVTKDANGNQVSDENYDYGIINEIPQVVKTTNSEANGISTSTYIQHPSLFDPSALLIPGAPKSTLFLASSATFTDSNIKNYTIFSLPPVLAVVSNVRYQYAGGLADNITYTYENKE